MEVRSFRTVFELERRIYRIDRFRLNPSGIPLRGVAYFAVAAIGVAIVSRVPVAGMLIDLLPWYVRYVGLPLGLAVLLSLVEIDGRAFHVAAWALWNGSLRHARTSGFVPRPRPPTAWVPPPLVVVPDGADPWLRSFRFRGPGAVLVRGPHLVAPPTGRSPHGKCIRVTGAAARGAPSPRIPSGDRVINLGVGAVVLVRGRAP